MKKKRSTHIQRRCPRPHNANAFPRRAYLPHPRPCTLSVLAPQTAGGVSVVMEMEQLVALCKRRGFLFQSSEIYGGLNGFWDYGPMGVELKRNIREAWWRDMVTPTTSWSSSPAPVGLRNGRARLRDHYAPPGVEGQRALRPVQRHDGRLPGHGETLPVRSGQRPVGHLPRADGLHDDRQGRRRRAEGNRAAGAEVLRRLRQGRRQAPVERDGTFFLGERAFGQARRSSWLRTRKPPARSPSHGNST